ncbi:protein TolQ [Desulfobacca acetoxidans]
MDIINYFRLVNVAWAANGGAAAVSDLDVVPLILNAGPVVKGVMFILLVFSVACWGIIFAKVFQLSRAKKQTAEFLDLFWGARNLSTAYHETRHLQASPVAAIFRLGYIELGKLMQTQVSTDSGDRDVLGTIAVRGAGVENVNRSLRRAMNTETTRLSRAITFLATTGNTAPFIGLFGTVWGIMTSFRGIGLKGSASLAVVAPGISEALVATAVGLAAAIPAVVAYNYFLSKVRVLETEMASFISDFLNIIERDMMRRAQMGEK